MDKGKGKDGSKSLHDKVSNPFSVHHQTRKGDPFNTSIKILKDSRKTIPEASNKEIRDIPTQNPKSNLIEEEVNVPNEEQSSKVVGRYISKWRKMSPVTPSPKTLNATIGNLSCNNICVEEESRECKFGRDHPWN
ncbi:hypothetical protein ACH5RR_012797 [Cinchona calisaya]|uniref:Uncharacterized protein n=1 Tax=Cinchona calisaya TaxID=153742 RepID=A0ABD3A8R5_9GENT